MVTLITCHVSKYKVHIPHHRHILNKGCPHRHIYPPSQPPPATQVCASIRQNQLLFKTGQSQNGEYMPLGHSSLRMYLWWSSCILFMYRVPGESYRRKLRSLLLCLCDVFRALINSLVCFFFLSFFFDSLTSFKSTLKSHLFKLSL